MSHEDEIRQAIRDEIAALVADEGLATEALQDILGQARQIARKHMSRSAIRALEATEAWMRRREGAAR